MKSGSFLHAGSHLALLFPLMLFSTLSGCYVDVPPADPESVSRRLSELLGDPDPEVRRTAAEALGKIGHQSANSTLIAALADRDPRVRATAALALGRVNDQMSGAALVEHLEDPSEAVRRASALALGEVGVSAAHEGQILQALRNSDVSTRVAASLALLSLDTVSFSTDLVAGLKDSDPQVRQGVAAVLGETGDVRSLPSLVGLLKNDADAGVRAEAAFRLGKVGDTGVLGALSAVVEKDSNPTVREWAHWASRQIRTSPDSGSVSPRGQ
ncbi:MAG: HEAT repeat domain-containing protein [Nitrospira sp.]|jgi:HEAT repeat protein|nr:HEAT repeat domain-containing protein [Nitrospira sp.]